jgi:hypothetical protein
MTDAFIERLKQISDADCVRMCFKDFRQPLSRHDGEILFTEIDRLREERAALEQMCRYFAGKCRGQDNVAGKVAATFYEHFGET